MAAVAEPPGPDAVIVYVVVAVGLTEVVPFSKTGPIPLSIVIVSALVVVQLNAAD